MWQKIRTSTKRGVCGCFSFYLLSTLSQAHKEEVLEEDAGAGRRIPERVMMMVDVKHGGLRGAAAASNVTSLMMQQ